jgi:tyrosine-specific transport protein
MNQEKKSGSVFGGVLLVAGCCIGAGMLGIPVLTAQAGFQPSLVMFLLSWLFMTATGLLLLEVNLWFKNDVNIVSMAKRSLGTSGKWISWFVFLFLFYSLMVAYVSGSGELLSDLFQELGGIALAPWIGSLIFIFLFGWLIYLGTEAVDRFNRLLMFGLIICYFALIAIGSGHVDSKLLSRCDWKASAFILPAMIVSFGFHNLVPNLTSYFKGDVKRLKLTILLGSTIPLLVYLLWEWLILGIVPLEGEGGFVEALEKGNLATRSLKNVSNASWVVDVAQLFAFFALITSFLGVALSFVSFLADGLKMENQGKNKIFLCGLVLVPPFLVAFSYPAVFLTALRYAGGFGAVILFGILPALMVWRGRYHENIIGERLLPGGKALLALIIAFAAAVMTLQFIHEISN